MTSFDPLYLFGCGVLWKNFADKKAEKELLEARQSCDMGIRGLSNCMLARAQALALPAASGF